jgi:hypothetical protein
MPPSARGRGWRGNGNLSGRQKGQVSQTSQTVARDTSRRRSQARVDQGPHGCGDTGLRGHARSGDRWRDDRRRDGCQCGRAFVDRSAAVRCVCREHHGEVSGVIQFAFRPALDRQQSRRLDRARAAIAGSVHQHVSWKSAAMRRVALDRRLAGRGGRLRVGRWEPRNPANGRQDKSAAFGRAQVVGWVGFFDTSAIRACWHFCHKCQRYQRSERRRRHFPRRVQP